MDTETGVNFLALLTVAANAALVLALVAGVGGLLNPSLARARDGIVDAVAPVALPFAAVVATVATVGSLWLSEGADFRPCTLCWYQRIAMYPLVPVLWIAAARRDLGIRLYVWVVAGVGFAISTYHYLLEWFPSLETGSTCDPLVPCTARWFLKYGYLSIPFMAGSAFALIAVLLATTLRRSR